MELEIYSQRCRRRKSRLALVLCKIINQNRLDRADRSIGSADNFYYPHQVVGSITTINSSRKFSPISRYPAMKQLNRLTTWCRPKDWGNQVQNKKVLKYWSNMTGGLHQVRRGTPQRCGRRCIWKGAKDSYRVLRDEGNHRERRGRWHKLDFRKKVRQTTSGSWFR